jgi:putative ABC transport system permease protein
MNSLFESIRMALIGLKANKIRAALTMLGIIIGVAAVVVMVSVGNSFSAFMSKQFQGLGTNVLFVLPDREARTSAEPLTMADAQALTQPRIKAIAPVYQRSAPVTTGSNEGTRTISGVTPEFQMVRSYEVLVGRFIGPEEVDHRGRVAVLGYSAARDFFPGNPYPIGETIRLNNTPFEVIGVLAQKGSSGPVNNDDVIFVPLSTAQTRLFTADSVRGDYVISVINIQTYSEEMMAPAMQEATAVLRQRHRIEPEQANDFTIINQADLLNTFSSLTTILTAFLGSIAAISLLVGGIGIMNIMLVSVTERTREIGLRKAIGAARSDIMWQFLIEAMTLSVSGGLVGIVLSMVGTLALGYALSLPTGVSVDTVLLAVGFSAAVGLFFGIYPAMRAASLHPIEALRYE